MTDIGKEVLQEFKADFRRRMKKCGASSGNSELLPCPFCGTTDLFFYPDGDMEGHCIMGRHAPDCPLDTFGYAEQEDAVKAWNKRSR